MQKPLMRVGFPFALSLALFACRGGSQSRPAAQSDSDPQKFATAVGWQVGAGKNGVSSAGQFATVPGGQEDHLVPTLPNASQLWIDRCAGQLHGPAASIDIWITVTPIGQAWKISSAQAVGDPSPLSSCLINEINKYALPTLPLQGETRIALRLSLSKSA